MWLAAILIAFKTTIDGLFLAAVVIAMTVALFLIGFRKGR